MRKINLSLIIALMLCQGLYGMTYYVSKSGNDNNNGTSWGSAWATLNKVNSSHSGGDTVYFGTGLWRGTLEVKSGTAEDRTVYACSAFVQGITQFWASDSIGPWIQYSGNVYKAYFSQTDPVWGQPYCMTLAQIDGVYDTILTMVKDLPSLDSEGEFYHDPTFKDTIYAWRFGGGDPDSISDMEGAARPFAVFQQKSYITLWGFDMKYGKGGILYFRNSAGEPNNYHIYIEHCNITRIGGWRGLTGGPPAGNFAAIQSDVGAYDSLGSSHYTRIRACTLGYVIPYDESGVYDDRRWDSALGFYSMWNNTIDSNYVFNAGMGMHFKQAVSKSVIAYNVIDATAPNIVAGIWFEANYMVDSIYGNIIIGDGDAPRYGIGLSAWTQGYADSMWVLNNTIHKPYVTGILTDGHDNAGWIKYNIIDSVTNADGYEGIIGLMREDSLIFTIDSNMYYSDGLWSIYHNGVSWSTWQSTYSFDVNGSNDVDPGFANPSNGDFSRPYSGQEMDLFYGGRHWTRFGAWQPDTTSLGIYNVRSDSITYSSATILWNTNIPATSQVEYGLDTNYGIITQLDTNLMLNHSQPLTGLAPATLYHYRVRSEDAQGNESVSSDFTFSTLIASDTLSPSTINDLYSIPGTNVIPGDGLGEIIITWHAGGDDDTVGIAHHYEIRYSTEPIDGSNWQTAQLIADPPAPLAYGAAQYDTVRGLDEGRIYFLAIKAFDEAGNASNISNVADTFACGIAAPTQVGTEIDSLNTSVTVSSSAIQSYMPLYYEFALDSLETFPDPIIEVDLLADSVATATFAGLFYDVSYVWRCRAKASDNSDSSSWSPVIHFNLSTGVQQELTSADCVYPGEGAIVSTSRPVFTVRYVPDIDDIFFQVSDNALFSSPIVSGPVTTTANSSTNWQFTEPLQQGLTYYWRVSSNNAVWTAPISFSVALDIHAFPNPFRLSSGHTNITFTNLLQESTITISTISGNVVLKRENIGPGDWVWDVRNDNGHDLAPGVYLYKLEFASGSFSGKVIIIK